MRAVRWHKQGAILAIGLVSAGLIMGIAPSAPVAEAAGTTKAPEVRAARMVKAQAVEAKRVAVAEMPAAPQPEESAPLSTRVDTVDTSVAGTGDDLAVQQVSGEGQAVRVTRMGTRESAPITGVGQVIRVDSATGASLGRVRVNIPIKELRGAVAGSAGERLRLVKLPECALTRPHDKECQRREVVATATGGEALSADVAVSGPRMVLAAEAAPSGGRGDFTATKLSLAGSWSAGGSAGGFSYAYPMGVPMVAGGPTPRFGLAYSSQAVDGKTLSTNNQPSMVGEGWEMPIGFVERTYVACAQDGGNATERSGDLCWKSDNATLSYAGSSSKLVKVSDRVWKPEADDGSRVERLRGARNGDNDGEYWRLTKTDGTQVFFGRYQDESSSVWTVPVFGNHSGEPGHKAAFKDSWQRQAWRWMVDRVVDVSGNSMTFHYQQEKNKYGLNQNESAVEYTRGGWLSRAEYGHKAESETTSKAAARVLVSVAGRCLGGGECPALTEANAEKWPDVPVDQICEGSTCAKQLSPTFFSTKRLTRVTTQILKAGAYTEVDRWDFAHIFPSPGDTTSPSLWLRSITRKVDGGTVAADPTLFAGEAMPNRVDGLKTGHFQNGFAMNKYRLTEVLAPEGGTVFVDYSDPQCTESKLPAAEKGNTMRCFPQWWVPPHRSEPEKHWFHKYVVTRVEHNDVFSVSAATVTTYDYEGSPAWGYNDSEFIAPEKRTWSQWLGYGRVTTTVGPDSEAPLRSDVLYYRGRHGDGPKSEVKATLTDSHGATTTDHYALRGKVRESRTFNGATVVSSSVTNYDVSRVTGGSGRKAARIVVPASTRRWKSAEGGKAVETATFTTYDEQGLAIRIDSRGDVKDASDDVCTTNTYAHNSARNFQGALATQEVQSGSCATWSTTPKDGKTLALQRFFYDDHKELGKISKGFQTRIETASSVGEKGPVLTGVESGFDRFGRPTKRVDALGNTTTIAYAPTNDPLTTTITTTTPDPDGPGPNKQHVTVMELDPARSTPVKRTTGEGKEVTEAVYDAFGRTTQVWYPGRKRTASPSVKYTYKVGSDASKGLNGVVTEVLSGRGGSYHKSTVVMDGLLRPVQEQTVTRDDYTDSAGRVKRRHGRLVTTTVFDSRGLKVKNLGPVFTSGEPSLGFARVTDVNHPRWATTTFDGAGRPVKATRMALDKAQASTTTAYGGDRVMVNPPAGATPTTTIHNAAGRTVEVRHHKGAAPGSAYDSARFSYHPDGNLATMTDPGGATWRHFYDLKGNEIRSEDPDLGVVTSVFDEAGRMVSTTNGNKRTLSYKYDALGRRVAMAEGPLTLASWEYDTVRSGYLAASRRHLDGQVFSQEVTALDTAGRPTASRTVVPEVPGLIDKELAGTFKSTARYRPNGQIAYTTQYRVGPLPRERYMHYYDDYDRPTGLQGQSNYATAALYNPEGQIERFTGGSELDNPNWTLWEYNQATGLVDMQVHAREKASDVDFITRYTRDKALNLTGVSTEHRLAGEKDHQCFRRDHMGRMMRAWTPEDGNCSADPARATIGGAAPYSLSWTFDKSGNRLSETDHVAERSTTWTYPKSDQPRPHAPLRHTIKNRGGDPSTMSWLFDDSGNARQFARSDKTIPGGLAGSTSMEYDAENRLVKATGGDGDTRFAYDASGNRLVRRDASTTTLYLGNDELKLDRATKVVTGQRVYEFAGKSVAMRITDSTDRTKHTLITMWSDINNTATWQLNDKTNQLTSRLATPYGTPRGAAGLFEGTRGFVGGTNDPQLGFVHIGDRDYDPASGIFLQPDRLVDMLRPLTWNAYSYGAGDPLNRPDPTGLAPTIDGQYGSPAAFAASTHDPGPTNEDWAKLGLTPNGDPNFWKTSSNVAPDPAPVTSPPKNQLQRQMAAFVADVSIDYVAGGIAAAIGLSTGGLMAVAGLAVYGAVKSVIIQFIEKGEVDFWEVLIDAVMSAVTAGPLGFVVRPFMKYLKPLAGKLKTWGKSFFKMGKKNPCQCVTGNTTVNTPGGPRRIDDLAPGDRVSAVDPETGKTQSKPVVGTFSKIATVMVAVTMASGVTIDATPEHPLWVDGAGWVLAGSLQVGDHIATTNGDGPDEVTGIVTQHGSVRVHNFEVADLHTYTITSSGHYSHNCPANPGDVASTADNPLPGLPASAPRPLGLGSTGRTVPENLTEQLAMTEVRSAPGGRVLSRIPMNDPRWPKSEGWVKVQQTVNGVNIHYVRNSVTGTVDDFKFVSHR